MKKMTRSGMLARLIPSLILLIMASGISSAASRAQSYIEGKKKAYYEEVSKIENETRKKQQEAQGLVVSELMNGIDSACRKGRLDQAEEYYRIKTGMEKGGKLSDAHLKLLGGNADKIKDMIEMSRQAEKNAIEQISAVNVSYLAQCNELLKKTREMDSGEFSELVAYKQQLILPQGAVSPKEGKRMGGLDFRMYAGAYDSVDDLAGEPCAARQFTSSVGILWGMPEGEFGAIWEGYYYAEKDGEYEFTLSSSGVARLSLDGQRVAGVEEDGKAASGKGKVFLSRGWHPLSLEYVQKRGTPSLELLIKPEDRESAEPVPAACFSARRDKSVLTGL